MHSHVALVQAGMNAQRKRMRPHKDASPLTCRSFLEIVPVFRANDLLALMLNSQTPGGVSPFSGLCSRAAQCASRDGDIIPKIQAGGELFSRKSVVKGGGEQKLALCWRIPRARAAKHIHRPQVAGEGELRNNNALAGVRVCTP